MFPQNPNGAGKNFEASEQKPIIGNSRLERNSLNKQFVPRLEALLEALDTCLTEITGQGG